MGSRSAWAGLYRWPNFERKRDVCLWQWKALSHPDLEGVKIAFMRAICSPR